MPLSLHGEDEPAHTARDVALIERISAVPIILRILCDATGLGFGVVAHVTATSWTACAVLDRIDFGLRAGGQFDVATTLCHEIQCNRRPIFIQKASEDLVYREHPSPRLYGYESFVAVPIIRRNGDFYGTICALDARPTALAEAQLLPTLQIFAELIATQIEVEERLELTGSALAEANAAGVLREQFVAVLGHDLRNPIAAVGGGLEWLSRRPLDERAAVAVGQMRQSCHRISELVDNVLDFARGRLGGGIPAECREANDLPAILLQVVQELQAVHPQRRIDVDIDLPDAVLCDPARIGQLLSNLLANALTHGARDQPVEVRASTDAAGFRLSVGNRGSPIAPGAMTRLFQPFNRADDGAGRAGANQGGTTADGLGLGLYIASEIARAHGGTLDVSSSADATIFLLTIPAARSPAARNLRSSGE